MKRDSFQSRRWPSAQQELILKAALAPGAEAIEAWQASGQREALESTWDDSLRVLPMVYRNLARAGYDGADLAHLKGTYRRTWYHNQLLLRSALPLLKSFQQESVPFLLMKGAPLLFDVHGDSGVRSLGDFDVLVDPADGPRAAGILLDAGWRPTTRLREPIARTFELVHAAEFSHGPEAGMDLHSHALEECCYPGADVHFWQRRRAMQLPGLSVETLAFEDMLLHVCVHGSRGAPARVVHWIPDALAILRRAGTVDWDVMVDEARRRRVAIGLGQALAYLVEKWAAPVPENVISRLLDARHSLLERADWRVQERGPAVIPMAMRDVLRYTRLSKDRSLPARVVGFPEYLQALWGFERAVDVPAEALRRTRSRFAVNRRKP